MKSGTLEKISTDFLPIKLYIKGSFAKQINDLSSIPYLL